MNQELIINSTQAALDLSSVCMEKARLVLTDKMADLEMISGLCHSNSELSHLKGPVLSSYIKVKAALKHLS